MIRLWIIALVLVMSAPAVAVQDEEQAELTPAERQNNLGTQHAARGDFRQAAGAFRRAVDLDPAMTVAHYNLGLALARVRNHKDAAFAFQSTLRLAPRYFDAWFQLGLSLMATDRFGEAASAFEECLSLRRGSSAARFRLGQSYWKAGKWPMVIAQWDSLLNESPDHPSTEVVRQELPRAYYNVGLHHQGRADRGLARQAYEDALRLDASYVPALNNLAILLSEEENYEEAASQFEMALEIDPTHSGAQLGLATALRQSGRLDEAIERYQGLLAESTSDARVYQGLVLAHLQKWDHQGADRWLEQAEAHADPYDILMLRAYLSEHNEEGERYGEGYDEEGAREVYEEAIRRFPDRPEPHYNIGVIEVRRDRLAEAMGAFDRALSRDPSYLAAQQAMVNCKRIAKQQNYQMLKIK